MTSLHQQYELLIKINENKLNCFIQTTSDAAKLYVIWGR